MSVTFANRAGLLQLGNLSLFKGSLCSGRRPPWFVTNKEIRRGLRIPSLANIVRALTTSLFTKIGASNYLQFQEINSASPPHLTQLDDIPYVSLF